MGTPDDEVLGADGEGVYRVTARCGVSIYVGCILVSWTKKY